MAVYKKPLLVWDDRQTNAHMLHQILAFKTDFLAMPQQVRAAVPSVKVCSRLHVVPLDQGVKLASSCQGQA